MITVVGSSKNRFLPLDGIRERFLVDKPHTGDTIDSLNPYYCELTGMYYMWKNRTDDICGIEHYRRYFIDGRSLLGEAKIRKLLASHDIILNPYHHPGNHVTYGWFVNAGKKADLDKWLLCVKAFEPDFFDTLWKYMISNKLYVCNMFVCTRPILDRWCSWLFDMLGKYDKLVGLGAGNKRIDGYLAEHTLGAWCIWQKLRIAECEKKMV